MEKTEGGKPPPFLTTNQKGFLWRRPKAALKTAERSEEEPLPVMKKIKNKETTNLIVSITVYNAERSGAYIVNDLH